MNNLIITAIPLILAAIAGSFLLMSDQGANMAMDATTQQDTFQLRVAHLSPDAPNVDIWLDGARVLENVPFEGISGYLSVPVGEYRIQVSPAGENEPIVIDATVTFEANTAYTVAATGLLGENDLSPIVLIDNIETNEDSVNVRFVHTSPDAPAVDVAVTGGDVLFSSTEFRQGSDYLNIPAGTYDLEVRLAGTDTVALSLPGVELDANTNYSIFAIGLAGDGSLAALPALDILPE